MKFCFVAGLLSRNKLLTFKKVFFRTFRRNAITFFEDIELPEDITRKRKITKTVYIVAFRGTEGLSKRIKNICESFTSSMYVILIHSFRYVINPDIKHNDKLDNEEKNCNNIVAMIKEEIKNRLFQFSTTPSGLKGSLLGNYKWFFEKEKLIYSTLNLMKVDEIWLKGLCWCPANMKDIVNNTLRDIRDNNDFMVSNLWEVTEHNLTPPTTFRTNEFIAPFQEIVQTYGVATYKEVNPAWFTIITFPFLFGVMFGDMLHGLVIFLLSSYICLKKDEITRKKSFWFPFVAPRYLLLFMGTFSMFAGLIYNEFGAMPIIFTPSCFTNYNSTSLEYSRPDKTCVYPIGFDPIWASVDNYMQFVNSYKMKFSVFFGVIHMVLGIFMKGLNALHHHSVVEYVFEFIPQIIFMLAFFGYMDVMIVIKWCTDWTSVHQNAPTLITTLINIPLKNGDPGPVPLYGDGTAQQSIQQIIFCIELVLFCRCGHCMCANSFLR